MLKFMRFLPLLLLLLLLPGRCEGLTDSSLPAIFFPFGSDEGDSIVTPGHANCDGPISIPYTIFENRELYVSNMFETHRIIARITYIYLPILTCAGITNKVVKVVGRECWGKSSVSELHFFLN